MDGHIASLIAAHGNIVGPKGTGTLSVLTRYFPSASLHLRRWEGKGRVNHSIHYCHKCDDRYRCVYHSRSSDGVSFQASPEMYDHNSPWKRYFARIIAYPSGKSKHQKGTNLLEGSFT